MKTFGEHVTRRVFTRTAAAAGLGALAGCKDSKPSATPHDPPAEAMQYRVLGSTGEKVSSIGLGGFHIGVQKTELESIQIIRTAIDGGINFLDNCWDYNKGQSEIRTGFALRDG